jgi:hypothetical protein
MKCKYSFPVKGNVLFPFGICFSAGDRFYQFNVKEGLISDLSVTITNFPEHCLPTIRQHNEGKVKASISIPNDPFWDDLVSDIRTIEGALCIWGISEIDVEYCTIEWIPETESEKEKTQIFSFSLSRGDNPSPLQSTVDVFVRSILAVSDLKGSETPLNFYRRGRLDVFEERYIYAIYDLFFVLETLFAEGKFKKKEVVERFLASKELLDAINHVKENINPQIVSNRNLFNEFSEKYLRRNEDFVKHIVDLRGFLHHHTLQKKNIWHPSKQKKHKVDALTLLDICHHIVSRKTFAVLFKQEKMEEFLRTEVRTIDGQIIRWNEWSEEE